MFMKTGKFVLILMVLAALLAGCFETPEARLRERISIDARDDVYLFNGADLYMYSDDHSTQELHIDGASGALSQSLDTENLGSLPTILSVSVDIDNDSSPVVCATIADGEIWFIHQVYANVLDNFATGGSNDATFNVGDGNDADGLLDLDDAELQAADVDIANGTAGWQGYGADTIGAFMAAGAGFIYAPSGAAETIDCSFAGTGLASDTASTADDITIYVVYTRIQ